MGAATKMNLCEAGHKGHERTIVSTVIYDGLELLMQVYDAEVYRDTRGYCTGDDDVSRTIISNGMWEPDETRLFMQILNQDDKAGLVLDFGAHVGWFSIIAAKLGYKVRALEGDPENLQVLKENAELNGVGNKIMATFAWVDEHQLSLPGMQTFPLAPVELIKIDLEGNEQHAIRLCQPWLEHRRAKYVLMEVSPVFNDSYPALVQQIVDYGYRAYQAGPNLSQLEPFDFNYDFPQTNLLFVRQP